MTSMLHRFALAAVVTAGAGTAYALAEGGGGQIKAGC